MYYHLHDGINVWSKFNGHRCYSYHATCKKNFLQVNEKSCRLRMGAYRDGIKRKRDKIGMGL